MDDPYNLQRFVEAQAETFETARDELRAGAKRSHWMWFIFPQLRGLGHSQTALFYGLTSLDEARAFLRHPLLGARLIECCEVIMPWASSRTTEQIFGSIDAIKLRSCMSLFEKAALPGPFAAVLDAFYAGQRDERTLALLNGEA